MSLWSFATIAGMAIVLWLNATMLATPYVRYLTGIRKEQRDFTGLMLGGSLLLTLAVFFFVQVGYFAGSGLSGMSDPLFMQLIWAGPAGSFIEAQGYALALWGLYVSLRPLKLRVLCYVLAMLVLGWSYVTMGHSSGAPWWQHGIRLTHLLTAFLWIGSLNGLRKVSGEMSLQKLRGAMERFGKHMSLTVPLVLVAGVVYYRNISGQWLPELPFDSYEMALVGKTAIVVLILCLALLHKAWLVPRLTTRRSALTLKYSITVEMILAGAILVLASALSTSLSP